MTIYSATHPGVRTASKPGLRQLSRLLTALRADLHLLPALGRTLMVLLPLVVAINLAIAAGIANLDRSLAASDDQRHQLMDRNISLLATKARLYAPDSVQSLAATRLALYQPGEEQIGRFNRRTGTFSFN